MARRAAAALVLLLLAAPVHAEEARPLKALFAALGPGNRFQAPVTQFGAIELVDTQVWRNTESRTYMHIVGQRFNPAIRQALFTVEFLEITFSSNGVIGIVRYEFCSEVSPASDGTLGHGDEWGYCLESDVKMETLKRTAH